LREAKVCMKRSLSIIRPKAKTANDAASAGRSERPSSRFFREPTPVGSYLDVVDGLA
jgi:hypothetical protein